MTMCLTPAGCALEVVDSVWADLADQIRTAAGAMLTDLFGWWTATGTTSVDQPVLHTASTFVLTWIALPVAVLALLATVGWGLLSGTQDWVRNVVRGRLVFGATASASIVVVALLQDWSESLAGGRPRRGPDEGPRRPPRQRAHVARRHAGTGRVLVESDAPGRGAPVAAHALPGRRGAGSNGDAAPGSSRAVRPGQPLLAAAHPRLAAGADLLQARGRAHLLGRPLAARPLDRRPDRCCRPRHARHRDCGATDAPAPGHVRRRWAARGSARSQLRSHSRRDGRYRRPAHCDPRSIRGRQRRRFRSRCSGPERCCDVRRAGPRGGRSLAAGAIRPAGASSSSGAGAPSGPSAGPPVATSTPAGSAGGRAAAPPSGAPPNSSAGPTGSTPPGTSGGPR